MNYLYKYKIVKLTVSFLFIPLQLFIYINKMFKMQHLNENIAFMLTMLLIRATAIYR